jgi:hypothetical protein
MWLRVKRSLMHSHLLAFTSMTMMPCRQRQSGAPSEVSSTKSECSQAVGEPRVLGVRSDIHDGVDVPGGTDAAAGRIRDKDAGCASADEDEFIEDGRQQADDRLEEGSIRISHAANSAGVR